MTANIPQRVTAALLGVVAGHFLSLEIGTARVLDALDDEAYLRFKTTMDSRYRRRIGPLWTASLLTGAAALVTGRRGPAPGAASGRLHASFALNAAAFVVLLAVNEPVNAEHARILAGEQPAAGGSGLRRRWNVGQTARTWLVGAAFVLQLP